MDWLHALFTDENSIAHIVLLYAFVIAVGVLLGKIKFFGVSLGVTFVLFTGIVCGHFGFTGKPSPLTRGITAVQRSPKRQNATLTP